MTRSVADDFVAEAMASGSLPHSGHVLNGRLSDVSCGLHTLADGIADLARDDD